jgi:hypothetical protein
MRQRLAFIATLLLTLAVTSAYAQTAGTFRSGKWGIEADYLIGTAIKHSKKINHVPAELSHGVEIAYFRKTLGEKPWHRPLNFPEVGGVFTYYHLGENSVFGDAYSIMGFAKFFIARTKVVDFYVRLGAGFSVMTRKYDYISNPTNNIISTTINNAIQIRLGMDWKVNPYLQLVTAFSFNHYSNSSFKLPNYGLNMVAGTVGFKVYPQPREMSYNCTKNKDYNKNEIIWKYSLGVQETFGFNGPKYPVHVGTICYARYTSPANKLYAGLSFEYFRAVHDWLKFNDIPTRYSYDFESSVASVIIGDEIQMGHIGMFYSGGVYLWKNWATTAGPIYFKVGTNVYFAQFGKRKVIKFFGGTNVKAHTSVAQYWEFSAGGTGSF